MKRTAVGITLGLAGALAASHAVRGLLYGVGATDPATLAAVISLLLVVTIVACLLPAWRAARVSPLVALRGDWRPPRSGRRRRKREGHGGAAADLALHRDLAAVSGDEIPGDGQAQPGAVRPFAFVEAVEDPRQLVGGDAGTGVTHPDDDAAGSALRGDGDGRASLGVADRVRDQVRHHLADAQRIDVDEREVGRIVDVHRDTACGRLGRERAYGVAEEHGQVRRLLLQAQRAALGMGEGAQVLHQAGEEPGLFQHLAQARIVARIDPVEQALDPALHD